MQKKKKNSKLLNQISKQQSKTQNQNRLNDNHIDNW